MPPRILENQIIEVAESNAGGGEHNVYKRLDGPDVVKIRRKLAKWQTEGEDFLIQSEQAMEREDVPRLPSVILINPIIVVRNPKNGSIPKKDRVIQPPYAQMFPKIKDYDSLTLRWPQLQDPQIQEQIIRLCEKAERIYEKDHFGLDPIGFAALGDNIQGVWKEIMEIVYEKMPKSPELTTGLIRDFIRMYVEAGVPGQMRNILVAKEDKFLEGESALPYNGTGERMQIMKKGGIILGDTGVHDLRPTDPINLITAIREAGIKNVIRRSCAQQLTSPAHYIMWGAMVELLLHANPSLATRPNLPFTSSERLMEQIKRDTARKVARALVEMMVPKFKRHENSRRK